MGNGYALCLMFPCNALYKHTIHCTTHFVKPRSKYIAKALNLWYSTVKESVNARKLVSYTYVYNVPQYEIANSADINSR